MPALPPPPPPGPQPERFPPPPSATFHAVPPPYPLDPRGIGAPPDTSGLRVAAVVLMWCVVGASALAVLAVINRRSVFENVRDGGASLLDLEDADAFVAVAVLLEIGLVLAAAIVISIWSLRTAGYVRSFGASDVSPGLACGGWYIPYAWAIVPFVQLRRVVTFRGRSATNLNVWQGTFIAVVVVASILRTVADVEVSDTADDVSSTLTTQVVLTVVGTLLYAAGAFFATRAMRDADGLTPASSPL